MASLIATVSIHDIIPVIAADWQPSSSLMISSHGDTNLRSISLFTSLHSMVLAQVLKGRSLRRTLN